MDKSMPERASLAVWRELLPPLRSVLGRREAEHSKQNRVYCRKYETRTLTSPNCEARLGNKFSTIVVSFAVFIHNPPRATRTPVCLAPHPPRFLEAVLLCRLWPLPLLIGSMPPYVDIPLECLDPETCTLGGRFIRWALVQARGI